MILSIKRITKTLIRLCVCLGWSAPLKFANPERHVLYLFFVRFDSLHPSYVSVMSGRVFLGYTSSEQG